LFDKDPESASAMARLTTAELVCASARRSLDRAQEAADAARAQLTSTEAQLCDARADAARAQRTIDLTTVIANYREAQALRGRQALKLRDQILALDTASEAELATALAAHAELTRMGVAPGRLDRKSIFAGLVMAYVEENPSRAGSFLRSPERLVEAVSKPLSSLVAGFNFLEEFGKAQLGVAAERIESEVAALADYFGTGELVTLQDAERRTLNEKRARAAQAEQKASRAEAAAREAERTRQPDAETMVRRAAERQASDKARRAEGAAKGETKPVVQGPGSVK